MVDSIRDALPASPGTYVLVMTLAQPHQITVGRLGLVNLPSGNLLYVGSAHGPGGLRARVSRHLRSDKRPHWHIDALTAVAPANSVWWSAQETRLECVWSRELAILPDVTMPVPGFGSSDCACRTHLYHVPSHALKAAWQCLGEPTAANTQNTSP